jgi:hypothetical protein
MVLIALISLVWLAVATLVVAACQVSAQADRALDEAMLFLEPFRFEVV